MASTNDVPTAIKFGTAGLGGIMGWCCVHPFNVLAVRANLASMEPGYKPSGFFKFAQANVAKNGAMSLYDGLSAGCTRQIFYATSRFGLFETFRDIIADRNDGVVDVKGRLAAGLTSGACAAIISCPAEVCLVRMANDSSLPKAEQRGYTSVVDAGMRILKEEGAAAFWRGAVPFVQRAMLVGVCQVGTYDQGKQFYEDAFGIQRGTIPNVFCAAMTSGLFYSLVTMPFESSKNRMAFQKPDPKTGVLPYRSTFQTMTTIAKSEGPLALWNGFPAYYGRCGGHTVTMFIFVEWLRNMYLGN
jgi:solute carrier family 25 oxoglutarate transporter 11